jgi:oxygen-independent coproporphyrinogen-3 oxidase
MVERVLLKVRIRDGIPVAELTAGGRNAVAGLIADELIDAKAAIGGTVVVTRRGRLLADAVVRRLLD